MTLPTGFSNYNRHPYSGPNPLATWVPPMSSLIVVGTATLSRWIKTVTTARNSLILATRSFKTLPWHAQLHPCTLLPTLADLSTESAAPLLGWWLPLQSWVSPWHRWSPSSAPLAMLVDGSSLVRATWSQIRLRGFTPVFSFGVDSFSLSYPLGDHKAVVLFDP